MKRVKRGFRREVKHNLNVLHIYARLCSFTTNRKKALKLASLWERTPYYRLIYLKKGKGGKQL